MVIKLIIIALAIQPASTPTLFIGFELAILLILGVALFFQLGIVIIVTAITPFANNFLKEVLLGNDADAGVLLRPDVNVIL